MEVATATSGMIFHLTPASAAYWREWTTGLGAIICGRTLFDFTDGWGGRHTMDAPVIVVTHRVPTEWVRNHRDAPFEFVTDGVAAALALGLLYAVAIDLVPVIMGGGRPFFSGLPLEDIPLGDPAVCIPSARATHLWMPVLRTGPS